MANIIKHPVKNDADGAPTTGQLVEGEILLNAYSGRAFFKKTNPSDSIVEFLTDLSPISVAASTTGGATLNVPHGAAPTAPADGDIWTTTAGLYVRINGATIGPLS